MGGCVSTAGDPVQIQTNKEVDKALKETKEKMAKQVKVLLLGSGDSGKSTILKQMRLIHKVAFTAQESESYRQLVFNNVILGMKSVLEAMGDLEIEVAEENKQYVPMFETFTDLKDSEAFPVRYQEPLKCLRADPAIEKTYQRANEVALPENLIYYLGNIDRLWSPSYSPSDQDIVRTRARTTGISETAFKLRGHDLHMIDVGGQKSERRKWIHCFQDVTTILFLVSLSGYDQCLIEDKDANQMQDAMAIWDSVCHSQWFKTTSIILFLNKTDIFEEKIKHSDIKATFPDYEGTPGDAEQGKHYFKRRFMKLSTKSNRQKEREIYTQYAQSPCCPFLGVLSASALTVLIAQVTQMLRIPLYSGW